MRTVAATTTQGRRPKQRQTRRSATAPMLLIMPPLVRRSAMTRPRCALRWRVRVRMRMPRALRSRRRLATSVLRLRWWARCPPRRGRRRRHPAPRPQWAVPRQLYRHLRCVAQRAPRRCVLRSFLRCGRRRRGSGRRLRRRRRRRERPRPREAPPQQRRWRWRSRLRRFGRRWRRWLWTSAPREGRTRPQGRTRSDARVQTNR